MKEETIKENKDLKNFHRIICEASGYHHDEKDWQRDQASLAEFIRQKNATIKELAAASGLYADRENWGAFDFVPDDGESFY